MEEQGGVGRKKNEGRDARRRERERGREREGERERKEGSKEMSKFEVYVQLEDHMPPKECTLKTAL